MSPLSPPACAPRSSAATPASHPVRSSSSLPASRRSAPDGGASSPWPLHLPTVRLNPEAGRSVSRRLRLDPAAPLRTAAPRPHGRSTSRRRASTPRPAAPPPAGCALTPLLLRPAASPLPPVGVLAPTPSPPPSGGASSPRPLRLPTADGSRTSELAGAGTHLSSLSMGSISPVGVVAVVVVELGRRVRRRAEPQATASARASGRRVDVRLRLPRRGAYLGGKSRGARTPAELARAFVAAELMRRVRRRAEPRAAASVRASGHRVACASGCRGAHACLRRPRPFIAAELASRVRRRAEPWAARLRTPLAASRGRGWRGGGWARRQRGRPQRPARGGDGEGRRRPGGPA